MEDIMMGDGITLLDRLDFLRGFLMERRRLTEQRLDPGDNREAVLSEIDTHLATVDDACEALQFEEKP